MRERILGYRRCHRRTIYVLSKEVTDYVNKEFITYSRVVHSPCVTRFLSESKASRIFFTLSLSLLLSIIKFILHIIMYI